MKQSNKKHKGKSKRKLAAFKTSDGPKAKKVIKKQSKHERKQMLKEKKKLLHVQRKKLEEKVGGEDSAPLLVAIVPLSSSVKPFLAATLLKHADDNMKVIQQSEHLLHLHSPLHKKYVELVCCPGWQQPYTTLDVCNVADRVMFLCPASAEKISHQALDLITAITTLAAAPHSLYAVMHNNDTSSFTAIRSQLEVNLQVSSERVWPLGAVADSQKLMRHLCQKSLSAASGLVGLQKTEVGLFRARASLLVETMEVLTDTRVRLHGFLRNQPLQLHQKVHVPGCGDCVIVGMGLSKDPRKPLDVTNGVTGVNAVGEKSVAEFSKEREDEELRFMRGYQLDREALEVEEEDEDEDVDMSTEDEDEQSSGESDEWVEEEEASDRGDDEPQDNDGDLEDEDAMSVERGGTEDEEDLDENKDPTQIRKRVPVDIPARVAFAKYTGIPSLKKTEFPLHENLPRKYGDLVKFPNFVHARHRFRNHLQKVSDETRNADTLQCGAFVFLEVELCETDPGSLASRGKIPVVFGLLACEGRQSVLHIHAQPTTTYKEHLEMPVVRSKERVLVQMGFRRMLVRPIFSKEVKHTDRYLYARFLPRDSHSFATFYAPVSLLPTPILMWRTAGDKLEDELTPGSLFATGSIATVNPDVLVLKRILLSGKPVKVKNTFTRVTGMFHSPEDVEHFKEVALFTMAGDEGKIIEPIGTHGIMKVRMRKTLKRQTDLLMPLYKRQFPIAD